MKKIKLLIIVFILPLFLISCSNQYDGGIYTGSSMSSKKSNEQNDEENIVIEEKLTLLKKVKKFFLKKNLPLMGLSKATVMPYFTLTQVLMA